jgi:hypothetical protein
LGNTRAGGRNAKGNDVVDNKLRVKDIAAELGIGNKDVMQACRDLDIRSEAI